MTTTQKIRFGSRVLIWRYFTGSKLWHYLNGPTEQELQQLTELSIRRHFPNLTVDRFTDGSLRIHA